MNRLVADILSYLMIGTLVALAAIFYPTLPETIPTHWNAAGEVDGYMSKGWGVSILPASAIFVFVLFKVIPLISPKGFRTDQFADFVNIFQVTIIAFTCGVGVLVLLAAKGYQVRMNEMIFVGVGLLFFIIGLFLDKVRKNFFLGIRTPWTLASDEVWDRTHRLGGKLFMLAGAIMVVAAFLPLQTGFIVVVIIAVALYPVLHSYLLYRRIEGFDKDPSGD